MYVLSLCPSSFLSLVCSFFSCKFIASSECDLSCVRTRCSMNICHCELAGSERSRKFGDANIGRFMYSVQGESLTVKNFVSTPKQLPQIHIHYSAGKLTASCYISATQLATVSTTDIFGGVMVSILSEIGGSVEENCGKSFFQVCVLALVPTFSVSFNFGEKFGTEVTEKKTPLKISAFTVVQSSRKNPANAKLAARYMIPGLQGT